MNTFARTALLLVLSTSAVTAQTLRRLDGSTLSAEDAAAFATRTLEENHVTGAQIAVINGGVPVWSFSYGLAGKGPDRPFDRETTTWTASITKAVVATYFMQLVEQGVVSLDTPVAQQLAKPLTAYPRYDKLGPALVNDPQWATVTPRMLLDHTSGLLNLYGSEPDGQLRLHFTPGTRFSYSTEGINLIGALIEAKLGKPLDELMGTAMFRPLGMKRTGIVFHPDFLPDDADRFDKDGKFIAQTRRDSTRAGGSMSSSADDLSRFLAALLDGKLLKPESMRKMLSPQVMIPTVHQIQSGANALQEGDEAKAVGVAYGLGWGLLTKTKYGPAFFKEGGGDGAVAYAICFEQSKSCMVILSNSDNGALAFRPLLEHILGDTVTPWEWECYTASCIEDSRKNN